ncbi:hypothetical protein BDY24DRAFT_114158 [Mrakia frigida]|uniref:uncharacterized protein n=1 Tax=Mrakia frigida TaxID=29902 RepID=UPI003FCBFFF3
MLFSSESSSSSSSFYPKKVVLRSFSLKRKSTSDSTTSSTSSSSSSSSSSHNEGSTHSTTPLTPSHTPPKTKSIPLPTIELLVLSPPPRPPLHQHIEGHPPRRQEPNPRLHQQTFSSNPLLSNNPLPHIRRNQYRRKWRKKKTKTKRKTNRECELIKFVGRPRLSL